MALITLPVAVHKYRITQRLLLLLCLLYLALPTMAQNSNYIFKFALPPGVPIAPSKITVDTAGNIYVAEGTRNQIQKFDSNGNLLLKIENAGSGDGQFDRPAGMAVDSAGNLFV